MSEYWKSTVSNPFLFLEKLLLMLCKPKYWCKHCKTFVRDTKLEKTNHEATSKHQGNLKRFLRDLHKGHEREEREKQRAKDEVDRLNGVVSRSGSKAPPWEKKTAIPTANASRQATPADRKKQLTQLAELGVAVPEDFRKEMAMVGDWQTTSERLIYDTVSKEGQDNEDFKLGALGFGVRKRKHKEQEEEEGANETVAPRGWGSTVRTYPGGPVDEDLDALLQNTKLLKREHDTIDGEVLISPLAQPGDFTERFSGKEKSSNAGGRTQIKHEESSDHIETSEATPETGIAGASSVKQEDEVADTGVVFKKRRAKPIRQK